MLMWSACFGLDLGDVWAQNYCTNVPGVLSGGFTLNKTKTCANSGGALVLTNTTSGLKNIQYVVGYDGKTLGTPSAVDIPGTTSVTAVTPSSPGTYSILQIGAGGAANDPYAKCQSLTVLPTEAPAFTTQSCGNRQVTLNFQLTPNTEQYDFIEVNWGDANVERFSMADLQAGLASHQYPAGATSYTITTRGIYKDITDCSTPATSRSVTPINGTLTQPFVSRLTNFQDGTVQMVIQGPDNTDFEVLHRQPDGSLKSLTQNQRNGSDPILNVNSTKTSQCFVVRTVTSCSLTASPQEYCTLVLDGTAVSGQNNLSWNPYTGSSPTIIWRLERNGTPIAIPGNTNRNTRSYSDNQQLQCNTRYCYRLSAQVGPTTLISNSECVTAISNNQPNALSNVIASVQNNGQVRLNTTDPNPTGVGVYTLIVSRSDGPGSAFSEIGQALNRPQYDDPSARTADQSYCYQLKLRNECGQESPASVPACTVWLTSKSPRALDWSADSPFGGKTVNRYEIEISDKATGSVIGTLPMSGNTHRDFDPDDRLLSNQYRYRIVAIAPNGDVSYSNFYELQVEAGIFAPTAFAPNGANNRFFVLGQLSDDFRMTIFDRWGAVVFSTTSFRPEDGWDGMADGQPAPAGSYAWRVEVRDRSGKQTVKASSVLLIR